MYSSLKSLSGEKLRGDVYNTLVFDFAKWTTGIDYIYLVIKLIILEKKAEVIFHLDFVYHISGVRTET